MSPDEAQRLLGEAAGRIDSIERIKHGLTNDSWLVRASAGALVIRRSNTSEQSLQIDRRSEALILDVVARAGLGPEVVHNDPGRHILITRYAGPTWTTGQAGESQNIRRIAQVFRELHGLPVPEGVRRVDLRAVVEGYLQTLEEQGVVVPADRMRALDVATELQQDCTARLCHNDVHALNVVDDGRLRLIDWEYAGAGEPFFDLASLCVYHLYDEAHREQLLTGYAGHCDAYALQRLDLCCWLFDYIRELWMDVRQNVNGEQ